MTATARKLAIIVYHMLKDGREYVDRSVEHYQSQYRERLLRNLRKRADQLGFELTPQQDAA